MRLPTFVAGSPNRHSDQALQTKGTAIFSFESVRWEYATNRELWSLLDQRNCYIFSVSTKRVRDHYPKLMTNVPRVIRFVDEEGDTMRKNLQHTTADIIARARAHKMTPAERREQRVSLVMGMRGKASTLTREKVATILSEVEGLP